MLSSTLAAESMSLSRGLGELTWCVTVFNEMMCAAFDLREWQAALQHRRLCAVPGFSKDSENLAAVDAKSLYDHLAKETCGHTADRRTALEMQIIRQTEAEVGASIRWIDHNRMIVDCMTKVGGNLEPMMKMLTRGEWSIVAEDEEIEARRLQKALGSLTRNKRSGGK